MDTERNVIVITGGNGDIGFEIAAQLMANPSNHVIIGSRSVEKGKAALHELQSRGHPGAVEMLQLDVKRYESVTAAAKTVERKHGKIDVLANNAAIGSLPPGTPLHEQLQECFTTNCIGPAMMVEAFEPLRKRATSTARIVNVSSGTGSITTRLDHTSPHYKRKSVQYRASKAALNMIHACQAVEYGELGMKVFTVCPGFTVSNLGPFNNEANGAKPYS